MSYTKELIKEKLQTNQKWVERAILAIYNKQSIQEQNVSDTIHRNGVGFNGSDARVMSYYAKWIESGKHLSGKHLIKATKKIMKYSGQLLKIAQGEI